MSDRCSDYQRWILGMLLRETQAMEARGDRTVGVWGVAWRPKDWEDWDGAWSPALRATVSRAVRRLADRGLVERLNQVSGLRDGTVTGLNVRPDWLADADDYPSAFRTTHVKLTDAGRSVADRLTST